MVFCPIAKGPCQGRAKCRLWIRGRLLITETKLLAAQLAKFILNQTSSENNPKRLTANLSERFWHEKGIANIQREILIDRYLKAKIKEVEELTIQWLKSPGFQEVLKAEKLVKSKASDGPHKPHCKSPP